MIALLTWWVGVLTAFVSYTVLYCQAFPRQGCSVIESAGNGSADGGIDLALRKGGGKFFV